MFKMNSTSIDWRTVTIVSALVLQVFFFAPLQIFLNNISEFSVDFAQLLLVFLVVSFSLIAVLYLLAGKLPTQIFLAAVTFLSVAAFLESRIFFGLAEHRPFDGQLIDWAKLSALSAAELTTVAVVALLVGIFARQQKVLYHVSLFILLFLGIGFVHTMFSQSEAIQRAGTTVRKESLYFDDFYRLSKQHNIIHIVLDGTPGYLVNDILTSNLARYSQAFDGFTMFTNAAGRYPRTYASVPFYMTGRAPVPRKDVVLSLPFSPDYIRTTLREHSIVNTLAKNGFKTFGYQVGSVYCRGLYTACTIGDVFHGLPVRAGTATTPRISFNLLDIALFQVTPIAIRRHIYNNEEWFLTRLTTRTRTHSSVLDLLIKNLTTDEQPGSYNYIHSPGGHPPIQFNENCDYIGTQEENYENVRKQVVCTLLQLERLTIKLKQAGIYDETLIIIHADHGKKWLTPPMNSMATKIALPIVASSANPVMLVKPLGARGHLKFSAAPVSIGDVPATIADAFGLDGQFPGIPMFRLDETTVREREYLWYRIKSGEPFERTLQALPMVMRFRIRGDLFDREDWILPHPTHLEEVPSALPMDHHEFSRFSLGFSVLETKRKRPARWVEGTLARVYLSFPVRTRAQLVFDSWVPPRIPGQSVEVSINGKMIASLGEQQLGASVRHVIPLPDEIPRKKVNVVEFAMGKALKFRNDGRYVSMVFSYVGLEALK